MDILLGSRGPESFINRRCLAGGPGVEEGVELGAATARAVGVSERVRERLLSGYGPWAVVAGASSGIGREMASMLAEAGLSLVLVARRREALERLAADLESRHGTEARIVAADLALGDGIEAVEAATGDLDVGLLVAAAGFGTSGPFLGSSLEAELEMLDVNCRAPLRMSLHFGRRFAAHGRGGVVLIGPLVGVQGTPNAGPYAATQA